MSRGHSTVVGALCVVAVIAVGLADGLTSHDLSFSAFYLLPVLVATSRSRAAGAPMASFATLVWVVSDLASRDDPYGHVGVPLWNAIVRATVFVVVVWLVSALKRSVVQERSLARRDPLTALANTRAFYEIGGDELRRVTRTGAPLTVAYIDIDDFKLVNDSLGHAAGDEVLAATGGLLQSAIRDLDTVARLGGDEFALLLPETDAYGAEVLLNRIHGQLTELARANGWAIGFSVGAISCGAAPTSVESLVYASDALMYDVKRAGKNAVRVESWEMPAAA